MCVHGRMININYELFYKNTYKNRNFARILIVFKIKESIFFYIKNVNTILSWKTWNKRKYFNVIWYFKVKKYFWYILSLPICNNYVNIPHFVSGKSHGHKANIEMQHKNLLLFVSSTPPDWAKRHSVILNTRHNKYLPVYIIFNNSILLG